MAELKGNTVYVVVYNYHGKDNSIIKIKSTLDDAYHYICEQENMMYSEAGEEKNYTLLTITTQKDVDDYANNDENELAVCFVKTSSNIYKFDLDKPNMSQFMIIPQVIE